jgi:hypothetical protein
MSVNIGTITGAIKLNDQFSPVMNRVASQMREQAGRFGKFGADVATGTSNAVAGVNRLGSSVGNLVKAFAGFYVARLAFDFLKSSAASANESERSIAQLNATIESTGGIAGQTISDLTDYSSALQRVTTFNDEAIQGAQGLLLTFTKIRGPVFVQATDAVLDMATAHIDLKSASIAVGKALNDPIKGVTALSRQGVQFSESQKDVIKNLVETGHKAEAQALILKELQVEFGGSARAARDTLGGALTALGNAWDDLKEKVGGSAGVFRDVIESMIVAVENFGNAWPAVAHTSIVGIAAVNKAIIGLSRGILAAASFAIKLNNAISGRGFQLGGKVGKEMEQLGKVLAEQERKVLRMVEVSEDGLGVRLPRAARSAGAAVTDLGDDSDTTGRKLTDLEKRIQELNIKGLKPVETTIGNIFGKSGVDTSVLDEPLARIRQFTLESMSEAERHAALVKEAVAEMQKLGVKPEIIEAWKMRHRLQVDLNAEIDQAVVKSERWASVGVIIQDAFAGVDSTFGRIGSAMGRLIEQFNVAQTATAKWAAGLEAVAAVISATVNKPTAGGFGGRGAGNFAGEGMIAGAIIGAIVGSIVPVIGTAVGAQVGSAAGSIIGSFIKKGADEALGQLVMESGKITAIVSKSEHGLGGTLRKLGVGINEAIQEIMAALGGTIAQLASVKVKVRDGVITVLVGAIQERFKTMEEAVAFAVTELLKQSKILGLSDTIKQILASTDAIDLDALARDLDFGRWYEQLGLGEAGVAMQNLMADFRSKLADAMRLGLDVGPVVEWAASQFDEMRESILGIGHAVSDQLADLVSYQRGVTEVGESLARSLAEAEAALAAALAVPGAAASGGRGDRGGNLFGTALDEASQAIVDSIPGLRDAIRQYTEQLNALPQQLTDQEVNMGIFDALFQYLKESGKYSAQAAKYAQIKVELEFAAIEAQLRALGKFEEFAEMFNDAFAEARRQAGRAGRGGGGGAGRRDARAGILGEIGGFGLGDVGTALRGAGQWFAEMTKKIKDAGFGAAETARLMGLAADELERRQAAIRQGVVDRFQEFMGTGQGPLAQLGRDFDALMLDITEAGFGASRTAFMVARLTDEYNRQLDALISTAREQAMQPHQGALDKAAGVGPFERALLDVNKSFDASREALRKLAKEAADAGRSTDFLAGDLARLDAAQRVAIQGIGVDFIGSLTALGASLPSELVMELAHAQFQLAQAQAMASALALAAAGAFDGLSITLEELLGIISDAKFESSTYFPQIQQPVQQLAAAATDASKAVDDLARRFADAKTAIGDLLTEMAGGQHGVVTSRQAFEFQQARFNEVMAKARTGSITALEAVPDIGRDLLAAMAKFSPALLAAQFPDIQRQLVGLTGLTTAHEGNVFTDERFAARHAEQMEGFHAVVAVGDAQVQQQVSLLSEMRAIRQLQQRQADDMALLQAELLARKR